MSKAAWELHFVSARAGMEGRRWNRLDVGELVEMWVLYRILDSSFSRRNLLFLLLLLHLVTESRSEQSGQDWCIAVWRMTLMVVQVVLSTKNRYLA